MSFIYIITNDVNDKVYIGKTNDRVEKRFREHLYDATRFFNRPLYAAIRKYGSNHFLIRTIEECSREQASAREQYWIGYYDSYRKGYNATLGGDGRCYTDTDKVFSLWNEGLCIKEIEKETGYAFKTIVSILNDFDVTSMERKERGNEKRGHAIAQLDLITEDVIAIFPSIAEACRALGKVQSGHFADVCNGKRHSIYGYKWKYIDK